MMQFALAFPMPDGVTVLGNIQLPGTNMSRLDNARANIKAYITIKSRHSSTPLPTLIREAVDACCPEAESVIIKYMDRMDVMHNAGHGWM